MIKILAALLCLIPFVAWGQSSPNWPTGYRPSAAEWNAVFAGKRDYPTPLGNGILYASDYGVVANGTTSDDVAMKAAVDACSARGATLVLPPGKIMMTGVAGTITLKNCGIVGMMVPGPDIGGSAASWGSTLLLTSTSVVPFTIYSAWSITGVNFYWPNMASTGLTVYPPLLKNVLGTSTNNWFLDHVNIINSYDGIWAEGGPWIISNSQFYATHEMFRFSNIGDQFRISNSEFTPGQWFAACSYTCTAGANTGTTNNIIFHFVHSTVSNNINFMVANMGTFAARYGIVVDAGVTVGISDMTWTNDGIATILKTAATAVWSHNAQLRGMGGCYLVNFTTPALLGNNPCFEMGAGSELRLDGWSGESVGSFIENTDSNIVLRNVSVSIGSIADGGDYYGVHTTANGGGLVIDVQGSKLSGQSGSTKTHGIRTDVAAARLIVQNNEFLFMNDVLNVQSAPTTVITGNWSVGTQGTASIVAATLATGGNGVVYNGNNWDKPPVASLSSCGTSPTPHGAFGGFFTVGGGGVVTACTITLPWAPYGASGGACQFNASTNLTLATAPTGASPPAWLVSSSGDFAGQNVFYTCPGQQ